MPRDWQRAVIVSFMLQSITLAFLLLSVQHWLLLLSKLQNLCTGISQQLNFTLFLLPMIITSVGFTICCCSVIRFFSITITSLPTTPYCPIPTLPLLLPPLPTISPPPPPPSCLHFTALHCHCFYNLTFNFHFLILHFTFTFYTRFVLS